MSLYESLKKNLGEAGFDDARIKMRQKLADEFPELLLPELGNADFADVWNDALEFIARGEAPRIEHSDEAKSFAKRMLRATGLKMGREASNQIEACFPALSESQRQRSGNLDEAGEVTYKAWLVSLKAVREAILDLDGLRLAKGEKLPRPAADLLDRLYKISMEINQLDRSAE